MDGLASSPQTDLRARWHSGPAPGNVRRLSGQSRRPRAAGPPPR
jgi:hypothetical protein